MKRLIYLASASPRRKALLEQIGLEPKIVPSQIEEVVTSDEPEAVVLELSRQKAMDVAGTLNAEGLVIGADTVVSVDGRILLKPGSREEAHEMLSLLQGRTHLVFTGVTIILCGRDGKVLKSTSFSERTEVAFWPVSEDEIDEYIALGEPFDKAGAYGIQGRFAAYVKGITGDYNNVVGLPLGRVYQEMKKLEKET